MISAITQVKSKNPKSDGKQHIHKILMEKIFSMSLYPKKLHFSFLFFPLELVFMIKN